MRVELDVLAHSIIYSVVILFILKRSVNIIIVPHDFVVSSIKYRLERANLKRCSFDFRVKYWSDWLVVLTSIFIKALGGHMEVLNLQMLDSIAKRSILIS
jgi:hypothetical protein